MKTFLKVLALVALPLFSAWAEAALASRAQGHLGFFGMAKETNWGTAVAATDYVELLSEGLSTGIDRFLRHPGFPVDIRHNAKIGRETLAAWAARQ